MNYKGKVIVGMSGGVDSSVAAYLLREQGYDVEGVSFILEERRLSNSTPSSCCSLESMLDARKTADRIGINHTMVNLRNEFAEHVIDPFIDAYSKGLTPNPCIFCNEHIKFTYLLKIADERGARQIATGHYARVVEGRLRKGLDARKDQSYVLYVLKREILDRLILPLGEKRKEETREVAAGLGLPSAGRPESQEICFVGGKNYFRFLEKIEGGEEGPLIDAATGEVLGRHRGIFRYTIGQRRRLGIATGKPLFVTRIDAWENAVYVGPKEQAMTREFDVTRMNWLVRHGGLGEGGPAFLRAGVKVRSTMKDEPAVLTFHDGRVKVVFDEAQWAPAPGQSAVFYKGDAVIGGGIITEGVA